MWLAILIIGTIIGGVIGLFLSYGENVFLKTFLCAAFFFVICFCMKTTFDDKTFICTDVTIGKVIPEKYASLEKKIQKNKSEILGAEMVLEFFDKSVKCTSVIKQKDGVKSDSFVLDELTEKHIRSPYHLDDTRPETSHTFQTGPVLMELHEELFITSFTITIEENGGDVVMTYKRKFF